MELPSDSDCRSRIKLRLDHCLKDKDDSKRLSEASQIVRTESSRSSLDRGRTNETFGGLINFYDKESILGLFEDNIEVKVADVPLTMAMSSVAGLTDLIEDEIIPKIIPIKVCTVLTVSLKTYKNIF